MSLALQLLMGGALFGAMLWAAGTTGVIVTASVLLALELWHDLGLYRNRDQRIAYRRWRRWDSADRTAANTELDRVLGGDDGRSPIWFGAPSEDR